MDAETTRCEEIHRVADEASGLDAWVVLHSTALGPAFGGTRVAEYASDDAALADAFGLAEAMTWKCALAELPAGGGKCVVAGERLLDRARALDVLADFVEQLRGRFRTAGDAGVTESDLRRMRSRTRFMADLDALGDLGDAVAIGVVASMRALGRRAGWRDLGGRRVVIQGLGATGLPLARRLVAEGASVLGSDHDAERRAAAAALGVELVDADDVLAVEADVFAPCAHGGVLDLEAARSLRTAMVCGGANRVLAQPEAGDVLAARGVVLAPDFVVNAGAVIRGAWHALRGFPGTDGEIEAVAPRVVACVDEAARTGTTPERVAQRLAQERLRAAARVAIRE